MHAKNISGYILNEKKSKTISIATDKKCGVSFVFNILPSLHLLVQPTEYNKCDYKKLSHGGIV